MSDFLKRLIKKARKKIKLGEKNPMKELLDKDKLFKCSVCEKFKFCTELAKKYDSNYTCKACDRAQSIKTKFKEDAVDY